MSAAEIDLTDDLRSLRQQVCTQLASKTPDERAALASRLRETFDRPNLPDSEIRAAEEVARQLAQDVMDLVRRELAKAVGAYPFLPRDIALRLAHDIDEVACPFLETSEVFSDEDWRQLILTISEAARLSVARRRGMTPPMAEALLEVGSLEVAERVVGNPRAPISSIAYGSLEERFSGCPALFEKLAERNDLTNEVLVRLVSKVSEAVREKLSRTYGLDDFTSPLASEAQAGSLLQVIRNTPKDELRSFAETLQRKGELGPMFVLRSLEDGHLDFFEAAMAVRAKIPVDVAHKLIHHGGEAGIEKLSERAGISPALKGDILKGVQAVLENKHSEPLEKRACAGEA